MHSQPSILSKLAFLAKGFAISSSRKPGNLETFFFFFTENTIKDDSQTHKPSTSRHTTVVST